jgi:hypothetical protein
MRPVTPLLLAALLSACATTPPRKAEVFRPQILLDAPLPDYPDARVGRMPQWYAELPEGVPVEIDNPHGSVFVRYNRGGRRVGISGTIQRLGTTPLVEDIRIEHGAEGVSLTVRYPQADASTATNPYGRPGRVDLSVLVPEGNPLRVRTRDGAVSGKRLRSDLDIETDSGDIEFFTTGTLRAQSRSGNISLTLSSNKWRQPVELSTQEGTIRLQLPVTAATELRVQTDGALQADPPALAAALTQADGVWSGRWGQPEAGQNGALLRNGKGGVTLLLYGWATDFPPD